MKAAADVARAGAEAVEMASTIEDFIAWYQPRRCTVTDEYVLFWPGPFSQWGKYDITIDGVTYNCCEQYMMAEKAKLFEDEMALSAIMAAPDPSTQKFIGRQVKNFDLAKWNSRCRLIVTRANYAKFTQYPVFMDMLLATGTRKIVEGSPDDSVWGIGMKYDDPKALNPRNWKGTNWLGEAIMKVRSEIIAESKHPNPLYDVDAPF